MTNIEKLKSIGILGNVRQRQGAINKDDDSQDELINKMSNHKLVSQWSGWHLGDNYWWEHMKGLFDRLESFNN